MTTLWNRPGFSLWYSWDVTLLAKTLAYNNRGNSWFLRQEKTSYIGFSLAMYLYCRVINKILEPFINGRMETITKVVGKCRGWSQSLLTSRHWLSLSLCIQNNQHIYLYVYIYITYCILHITYTYTDTDIHRQIYINRLCTYRIFFPKIINYRSIHRFMQKTQPTPWFQKNHYHT